MKILIVMFGIPLLFAYLVSGVINLGILLIWTYRRLFRPLWPQDERIIEDAGLLVFDDWMRIQSFPGKLTLVTLTEKRCPVFVIKPIPGLADSVYSSLLASLDLGHHLQQLIVETKTNLVHSELMAFLCRHPDLASIYLEPDSIRASSLTTIPASPNAENKVVVLTAPSPYIPYLLSAAPSVHRVTLLFTLAPTSTRVTLLRPAAFDLPAYRTALAALATLPGTHPLALNLTFRVTALSLPWLGLPDAEALDSSLFPETRLARVHALWLHADGLRFNAADIRALVRWLGLFPSLQRLTFAYGAVEKIPQPERAALAQAICSACSGINTPTDIAFNIKDN